MVDLNQLFLDDPKGYRKILLTEFQITILNTVIEHNVSTTKDLAIISQLAVATAGTQMRRLYEKGYLTRKLRKGKGKGDRGEYIYSVKQAISGEVEHNGITMSR